MGWGGGGVEGGWDVLYVLVCFDQNHRSSFLPGMFIKRGKMSMQSVRPTSLSIHIPNTIQNDTELCKTIGVEGFAFSHPCDLE